MHGLLSGDGGMGSLVLQQVLARGRTVFLWLNLLSLFISMQEEINQGLTQAGWGCFSCKS
jgi:hypothetical protein